MTDSELTFHPIASLFPLLDGDEFEALADDIREHGVREPIVLHDGMILDGRNRYRASQAAGKDCPMRAFDGADPLAFVVSLNLKRRHLSESQRAWVAAKIANLDRGRPDENPSIEGISNDRAADMMNVGRASVERARTVRDRGIPELQQAVEKGDIAVSSAAEIAKREADAQRELMKLPTPREAKRQATETGKAVVARDGMIYTDIADQDAEKRNDLDRTWHRLRDALEALTSLPPPADTAAAVPSYQHSNVTARLSKASEWLREFEELWNEIQNQSDTAA